MIASNEEKNIGRCLESVQSIAHEIILVHNDCTDKTVEIAESYGAKCFEEKWHGHRDQKKIALGKAIEPWVLFIDADERISSTLLASMKKLFRSKNSIEADGYKFNRKSFFLGRWIKHGDWYPDRKLRLVKRKKASIIGSSEHDRIYVNGVAHMLDGDLLHYSYPSMNSFIQKIIYFSDAYIERKTDNHSKWRLSHIIFRPIWRFIRSYFIRLGFLDGFPGFFIAISSSYSTFFKHSRLYEKRKMN